MDADAETILAYEEEEVTALLDRGRRKSNAGRKVKSASPAVPTLSRESSVEKSPSHRFERDSILIVTRIIEATNDFKPVLSGPKPIPFMYWSRNKDYYCAMAIIKRFPNLMQIAEKHYSMG
jgi:hypothetical protein